MKPEILQHYDKGIAIIYHDINNNARSMEMLACMNHICRDTIFVSYAKPQYNAYTHENIVSGGGKLRYIKFLAAAKKTINKENPDVILLHDNMTAPILKWLTQRRFGGKIIYDSSELYTLSSAGERKSTKDSIRLVTLTKDFKMWLLSVKQKLAQMNIILEMQYLKYANIVIAANIERAFYMKDHYDLPRLPLIFDNMHRIDDAIDVTACNAKYAEFFEKEAFFILYVGGIGARRRTFDLVKAACELANQQPIELIVVGRSEINEQAKIEAYLNEHDKNCFTYLGYTSRSEIRYLLQHSNVSVSAFAMDTMNNIYCESGKVYESLFEGVPIVTSENPPLQRLCKEHGVGSSNKDFYEALNEVLQNETIYRRNVQRFIHDAKYEERVLALSKRVWAELQK